MKLWEKNIPLNDQIESFTVGRDPEFDLQLAPYDVLGSIAHTAMLKEVGILSAEEQIKLTDALIDIYHTTLDGSFVIAKGMEDVHSQVEFQLTESLGDIGKKIHTGRSRNDQVLLDLRLLFRDYIYQIISDIRTIFYQLTDLSEKYRDVILPGYTHLQAAMPSSFGLWFGAYAENLIDDLRQWRAAFDVVNQNPLGSAAGYGTSLPIRREITTSLLGFAHMDYNVVHAQMGRGRSELFVAFGMAATGNTLAKLAMDVCLYNSQNFAFLTLPDAFTTGSSIMPHKKNPDVFELIRARGNRMGQLPSTILATTGHLPSGYHRDFQILKEQILPGIEELRSCLSMVSLVMPDIQVNENIREDERYKLIYSVEEVNKLVMEGVPFREAYQIVGKKVSDPDYSFDLDLDHSHEGSLGNLCNEQIADKFEQVWSNVDLSYRDTVKNLIERS